MWSFKKNEIYKPTTFKRLADIESRMLVINGRIDNLEGDVKKANEVASQILEGLEKMNHEKDEKKMYDVRKDEQGSGEDKEVRAIQTVQKEVHANEHD